MLWLQFLSVTAWPLVTLIIFWQLRQPLELLIGRIRAVAFKGMEARIDAIPSLPPRVIEKMASLVKTDIPASWYWLGNDIFSISHAHIYGADRSFLNERYIQTIHHLSEVGLGDSDPCRRLERLFEFGKGENVETWPEDRRLQLAREVLSIAREIGSIVEASQANFNATPRTEKEPPSK